MHDGAVEVHYVTPEKATKLSISKDTYLEFSAGVSELNDYLGLSSDILACHKFSRKQKKPKTHKIYLNKNIKNV